MMKRPKQNPKLKNVQNYWHKKGWEDREKFLPEPPELQKLIYDQVKKYSLNQAYESELVGKLLDVIHKRITEGEA